MDDRAGRLLAARRPTQPLATRAPAPRGRAPPRRSRRARRGRSSPLAAAALTLGVALPGGKTTAVLEPPPATAAAAPHQPARQGRRRARRSTAATRTRSVSYVSHMRPHRAARATSRRDPARVRAVGRRRRHGCRAKQIIHWDQADVPDARGQGRLRGRSGRPPLDDSAAARVRGHRRSLGMAWRRCGRCPPTRWRSSAKLENRDNVVADGDTPARCSRSRARRTTSRSRCSACSRAARRDADPERHRPAQSAPASACSSTTRRGSTLFLFDPETGALLGTQLDRQARRSPGARSTTGT